jgi:hypothetical protein
MGKVETRLCRIPFTGDIAMQKKKTFSAMEIALLVVLVGSLILNFLQARREEKS